MLLVPKRWIDIHFHLSVEYKYIWQTTYLVLHHINVNTTLLFFFFK